MNLVGVVVSVKKMLHLRRAVSDMALLFFQRLLQSLVESLALLSVDQRNTIEILARCVRRYFFKARDLQAFLGLFFLFITNYFVIFLKL